MLKVTYRFCAKDTSNEKTNYSIIIAQSYINKLFNYSIIESNKESSVYWAIGDKKGEFESFQEAWDQALYELYISGRSDYLNNMPKHDTFIEIRILKDEDRQESSSIYISHSGKGALGLGFHKFFVCAFRGEKKANQLIEVKNISGILKEAKKIYESIDSK